MRAGGPRGLAALPQPVRTTDSRYSYPIVPNRIGRNFWASAPNKVWLAALPYIPTDDGWLHLAALIGMHTRKSRVGPCARRCAPGSPSRRCAWLSKGSARLPGFGAALGRHVNNYAIALQCARDDVGVVLGWRRLVEPLLLRRHLVPLGPHELPAPASLRVRHAGEETEPTAEARLLHDWLVGSASGSPAERGTDEVDRAASSGAGRTGGADA